MNPKSDSRKVAFFRLTPSSVIIGGPRRGDFPIPSLTMLLDAWEKAISDDNAQKLFTIRRKQSLLSLRKIVPNEDESVTLLFSFGDANAAKPSVIDVGDNSVEEVALDPGKVAGYGCHMIISTTEQYGMYKSVLEVMPNLGKVRILEFLQEIARTYLASDPDLVWKNPKDNKPYHVSPRLSAASEKSQGLDEFLKGRRITEIEFQRRAKARVTDDSAHVIAKTEVLVVKVESAPKDPNAQRSFLERMFNKGKEYEYEHMSSKITEDAEVEGEPVRNQTIGVDLADEVSAFDELFTRHEIIEDIDNLPQCYDDIHIKMDAKLRWFLKSPGYWT